MYFVFLFGHIFLALTFWTVETFTLKHVDHYETKCCVNLFYSVLTTEGRKLESEQKNVVVLHWITWFSICDQSWCAGTSLCKEEACKRCQFLSLRSGSQLLFSTYFSLFGWMYSLYSSAFLLLIRVLCISMLQVLFSVSALKDLTPTAEIKASSRQAMIGSLSGQCTSWHLCGNRVCVRNSMNDKTYGNGDVCGALTAVSTVHDLYSCCVHKQTWFMQTIKTKRFECIVFLQNELSIIINTEPCYPTDLP